MHLSDLIQHLKIRDTLKTAAANPVITGIALDSRRVRPGDVFFAVDGTKLKGAKFIPDALKMGAVAVVCNNFTERTTGGIPVFSVPDVRLVLAQAASFFYGNPSQKLDVVGITGTNGKTTISYLLERLWGEDKTGVIGTVNIRWCGKTLAAADQTTPDPIFLQDLLARMVKDGAVHAALEISSHALDQKRAHALELNIAIFTNLTQDHLDYHANMESYYEAKERLFTEILLQSPKTNRLAIINRDDPCGARLEKILAEKKISVRSFSLRDPQATAYVTDSVVAISGTRATVRIADTSYPIQTSLIGQHNLQNTVAALLVGMHQNRAPAAILERLSTATIPGRLQRVSGGKHHGFFVDYAHTPDALENVLHALRSVLAASLPQGRLICVFGCGGDRDPSKRSKMGAIAARLADITIVTSDNPRTENAQEIINMILPGVMAHQKPIEKNSLGGFLVEPDRRAALAKAVELACPNDAVLVAGKGHEDYQIIGTTKHPFDDAKILEELLR